MSRYIDADEFLEYNKEFADREIEHPRYQETLRELIDSAPSIDIEPKRGEWKIKQDFGFLKDRIMMCSVCGDYIRDSGITVNCGRGDWNFCPNCGADMRKESE